MINPHAYKLESWIICYKRNLQHQSVSQDYTEHTKAHARKV